MLVEHVGEVEGRVAQGPAELGVHAQARGGVHIHALHSPYTRWASVDMETGNLIAFSLQTNQTFPPSPLDCPSLPSRSPFQNANPPFSVPFPSL